MARYIDADRLIEEGWRLIRKSPGEGIFDVIDIADVSTADVEKVIHAGWKEAEGGLFYCCTNCGYIVEYQLTSGCPNCRAKMDGGKEEC